MSQSVERFSSRVDNYIRYRPGYPAPIVPFLERACHLTPGSQIADLGSGTGKLAELLLQNGNVVYGIEPNTGMREAAESILAEFPRFRSIDGTAEATTLPDKSVDLVTAGQAFHWFDADTTKTECLRILKPSGWVVLVWNERLVDTPFLRDYENLLLEFGTDYKEVRHENAAPVITRFFAPNTPGLESFDNTQLFDFEGLKGRVLSSSYTPAPEDPHFVRMINRLQDIFDAHAQKGQVSFDYETKVYYGQLAS